MKKTTRAWLRKAEEDFHAAQKLLSAKPRINSVICFHCQQAAEKYLKAIMDEWNMIPPKTHDLEDLMAMIRPLDPFLDAMQNDLKDLTDYAVEYRYPGISATSKEAVKAMKITQSLRHLVRKKLGLRTTTQ